MSPRQKCPVPLVELRRRTWRGDIDQTIRPLLVQPDHPVAKRLPVHPADLGGLGPRCAIEHRGNRQKPPDLIAVLRRRASRRTSTAVKSVRTTIGWPIATPSSCHVESSILRFENSPESQHLSGLVLVGSGAVGFLAPIRHFGSKRTQPWTRAADADWEPSTYLLIDSQVFRAAASRQCGALVETDARSAASPTIKRK